MCSRSADSSAKQEARKGVPKLGFSVLFAVTLASIVGLSLRNCLRCRLRLGPSDSRLQKEHSVVARVLRGGGALRFE